jgi:hypothetical protein
MNNNVKLKSEYKKRLDIAAVNVSASVQERVTVAKIVYRLIDKHLDSIIEDIKKEY